MPYFGRAPSGTGAAEKIEGNLKVTGTISAESINDKFSLDATDGSASNLNDHFEIEAGGTDGSATNAGSSLLYEDGTGDPANYFNNNIKFSGDVKIGSATITEDT